MSQRIGIAAGGTGGHIFPALTVAKMLQKQGFQCVWFGRSASLEESIATQANIPFISVPAPKRLPGRLGTAKTGMRLARAVYYARRVLKHTRVDMLFATGAYVSLPSALAAVSQNIPIIIHEQNTHMGQANRLLKRFAHQVCLGMPIEGLPKEWVVGNPVSLPNTGKRGSGLLVMGGSQGCDFFNTTLPALLKSRVGNKSVIHIAGEDHEQVRSRYKALGVEATVYEFCHNMSEVYHMSDTVIARSGAMTLAEISHFGLGALLVPYPYAACDHQRKNAKIYADANAAIVAEESEEAVSNALDTLLGTDIYTVLGQNAKSLNSEDALNKIITIIQATHASAISD